MYFVAVDKEVNETLRPETETRPGAYLERVRGAFPQSSIGWIFFTEKNRLCWDCSLYQKCSVDLKYAKNALAAGAPPWTPLGELTTLPQTL